MTTFLIIFSVLVFAGYTISIALTYGVQTSISASYKVIPQRKYLYSFFILGIAIPMMFLFNTFLGWLAGILLAIDFVAPSSKITSKFQSFLHSFGAYAGIIIGFTALYFKFGFWIPILIMAGFSLYATKHIKNSAWWNEVAAFILISLGLIIGYLT